MMSALRKQPVQPRARGTIDQIVEAAARLVEERGLVGYNTNAVAALAGVSVGSLYQYFPDKESILLAVARRELETRQPGTVSSLLEALARALESLLGAGRVRRAAGCVRTAPLPQKSDPMARSIIDWLIPEPVQVPVPIRIRR